MNKNVFQEVIDVSIQKLRLSLGVPKGWQAASLGRAGLEAIVWV